MRIGNLDVGGNADPIVIAELGINHGGNLSLALKMADAAVRAGVDIVKHQFHIPDEEMSVEARSFTVGYIGTSIYNLMCQCALTAEEELKLKLHVEAQGCTYVCTPFSPKAARLLFEMGAVAFKIGSGEANNVHFVKELLGYCKPLIVSTGMNSVNSLANTFAALQSSNVEYALLHTTNIYPTPNKLVRLGGMVELARRFPGVPIGLSDHTISNHACFAAVALGAKIVERHFTIDKSGAGPDIINSMDECEAMDLVKGVRLIAESLGGEKGLVDEEAVVAEFAFQSVVTTRRLLAGRRLLVEDITLRRPGTGDFGANDLHALVGRVLKVDIPENTQIRLEHLL